MNAHLGTVMLCVPMLVSGCAIGVHPEDGTNDFEDSIATDDGPTGGSGDAAEDTGPTWVADTLDDIDPQLETDSLEESGTGTDDSQDDSCERSARARVLCLTDNDGQQVSGAGIISNHRRAILLSVLADTEIASVALYTAHATPLELPVELLGDQPTSGPGSVLATATLRVETRPGWYQANFDPPVRVARGERIWIGWHAVQGMLAPYAAWGPTIRKLAYEANEGEWRSFERPTLLRVWCCGELD